MRLLKGFYNGNECLCQFVTRSVLEGGFCLFAVRSRLANGLTFLRPGRCRICVSSVLHP